jgi:hypothetical protein
MQPAYRAEGTGRTGRTDRAAGPRPSAPAEPPHWIEIDGGLAESRQRPWPSIATGPIGCCIPAFTLAFTPLAAAAMAALQTHARQFPDATPAGSRVSPPAVHNPSLDRLTQPRIRL